MSEIQDKQAAEKSEDVSKGPIAGGSQTKPKIDPNDSAEVDEIVSEHQTKTGPKAD